MPLVEEQSPAFSTRQWLVVGLLVFSVVINYVDRSNLSIAAPLLAPQLSLSPLQMGSLLAAFSWTYAFLQLFGISGWFADRFPVGWVFLIGYILWSVATLATGFLSGFTAIFAARLLLGAGESIAYPCYSRVFAELPQHQRGRANSFIDAGTKLGPSAGALLGGVLMIHFGWRSLFFVLGFGGLLWIIPWLAVMPRNNTAPAQQDATQTSTWEILGLRSAWGTFLGHFCGNYFYYFLLTWLPSYLVKEAGLSLKQMTHLTSGAFLLIAVTTIIVGWITDRLIANGVSPTRVRKAAVTLGLASASLLGLIAFAPVTSTFSLAIFLIACAGFGAYAGNHWAISQTLAGPAMAGRWTGLQNGIANLSGIIGPTLAGAIVQHFGSLRFAFLITGVIALLGALSWAILVGQVEPVRWSSQRSPAPTTS